MAVKNWITKYKLTYKDSLFSVQILLVAFGALITLPILTGLDPNVALFTAGAGTLIFHFTTKRAIPVFLASSFAFTAPIMVAKNMGHSGRSWRTGCRGLGLYGYQRHYPVARP